MADIGILSAKVTANPTGFVAGLNTASAALTSFAASAASKFSQFSASASKALSGLAGAGAAGAFGSFGGIISGGVTILTSAIAGGTGLITAALAAVAALGTLAQSGIKTIGVVAGMAKQVGISTREMYALSQAAEDVGVEIGNQVGLFSMLLRRTGDLRETLARGGGNDMSRALAQMGISANAFARAGVTEQLRMVAQGMERITDPTARAAASFAIFGRRGMQLAALTNRGLGFFDQRIAAGQVGGAVSDGDLANMQAAGKAMKELGWLFKDISDDAQLLAGAMFSPMVLGMTDLLKMAAAFVSSFVSVWAVPLGGIITMVGFWFNVVAAIWRVTLGAAAVWMNGIAIASQAVRAGFTDIANAVRPLVAVIGSVFGQMNAGGVIVRIVTAAFTILAGIIRVGFAVAAVAVEWIVDRLAMVGAYAFMAAAMVSDALGPAFARIRDSFMSVVNTIRASWAVLVAAFQAQGIDITNVIRFIGSVIQGVLGAGFMIVLGSIIFAVQFLAKILSDVVAVVAFLANIGIQAFTALTAVVMFCFTTTLQLVTMVVEAFSRLIAEVERYVSALRSIPAAAGSFLGNIPGVSSVSSFLGIGGAAASGVGSPAAGGAASPTAGISATLRNMASAFLNFRNTATAASTPATGPVAGQSAEIGAKAATRDSVEAVTAIINAQWGNRNDPTVTAINATTAAANGTTSAVDNLTRQITALLANFGAPTPLGGS